MEPGARSQKFRTLVAPTFFVFRDHFKISKQPFYSAYTNQGDTRYVAEENIELVSGVWCTITYRAGYNISKMGVYKEERYENRSSL